MTPADSARLSLAKRAYQATQPSEREVQTGVRRARLSLRRSKLRRAWWLKGLVFVVLALGSIAYAKPHALGELVERGLPVLRGAAGKPRPTLRAPAEEPKTHTTAAVSAPPAASAVADPKATVADPKATVADPKATVADPKATVVEHAPTSRGAAKRRPSVAGSPVTGGKESPRPSKSEELPITPPSSEAVSEWGRVGQALASGDEAGALSALGKLSESDDARTRDKADLGRAQLLMAHGKRDQACALARSLTRRRAGGHIERQASMLLKDCAR
ncbi:MAG: hypothetical protein K0R38_3031 [Polyangiaceae bacterium]|jgi:hypothetical protein|nr:hypothetical protein [Polyangiaceae bacterium]